MESINGLKPLLLDTASLVDIAILCEKNKIPLKALLKQISENLHKTTVELDNLF